VCDLTHNDRSGAFSRFRVWGVACLFALVLVGCATAPPGAHYPKTRSVALTDFASTRLGRQFEQESHANGERTAFRLINVGVDGLLMRLEMINAAERTLDLQYFIFRGGDESGRLIREALLRAADRGVRVRVLVDDGDTAPGDEKLLALSGHGALEIRVFNPFAYRGHSRFIRDTEYLLRHSRLDYRMHNKMLIADGAVGLVGGRNVGDQYFQIDPASQFADDDVFAGGPIMRDVSAKFDEFWNSSLAIPAEALAHGHPAGNDSSSAAAHHSAPAPKLKTAGFDYQDKLTHGEPLAGVLDGELSLVWADAQFVGDSPDKKNVVAGARLGALMYEPIANAVTHVKTELLMVSPYFVPTKGEVRLLEDTRERGAHVAVLTNSLESAPDLAAHSGYVHQREVLLKDGVEFHEVRARLGNTRGSGESVRIARYGNYSLHGKLIVFDRQKVYIGSMNFDQRSKHLNTEIGLILNNADLSQQVAARFEAMTKKESAYSVVLRASADGKRSHLVWQTVEDGHPVELDTEPSRGAWQRFKVRLLALLPIDSEL
jgi:putative cardiolipin synthase